LSNTWQIFAGAVLTFLSLLLIEMVKSYFSRGEKRRNLKIFLRLEFNAIIKLLDRLKKYIEENSIINYSVIDATWKVINELEGSRADIIYLPKNSDQEKFFDVISDLSSFLNDARFTQQFYYDQKKLIEGNEADSIQAEKLYRNKTDLDTFFAQKRTEKLVELIDIKRRLEDYIKAVDAK
jgi:hypothetical protein